MEGILAERLQTIAADAAADKDSMAEELTFNGTSFDEMLETYAAFASANKVIEGYNMAAETTARKLSDVELLLEQPYFAKVRLRYPTKDEVRDLYIGVAGATDDEFKRLVVDWRSPVAEVYYNQENGPGAQAPVRHRARCAQGLLRHDGGHRGSHALEIALR